MPSHLYSYSFAPNPDFTHTYSPGDEIHAYFERVASEHGVDSLICYGEEVTRMTFVDGRWALETSTGRRDTADVVIAATGVLHHPRIADIPGIDTFEGASFHTARWDHSVLLEDRRVGVVGTGSSAIQITAALVERVERYYLFQRTAQWVIQSDNDPYPEEARRRFRDEPDAMTELRQTLSAGFGMFANAIVDANSPELKAIAAACEQNLEDNVRHPEPGAPPADVPGSVQAPRDVAELLRRDPAAQRHARHRPHRAHRARGDPDRRWHAPRARRARARHRLPGRSLPPADRGRRTGRVSLDDVWAERPTAYLSISIPEFPNLFMLNGPNGPVGTFTIEVAELQFDYASSSSSASGRASAGRSAPRRRRPTPTRPLGSSRPRTPSG